MQNYHNDFNSNYENQSEAYEEETESFSNGKGYGSNNASQRTIMSENYGNQMQGGQNQGIPRNKQGMNYNNNQGG